MRIITNEKIYRSHKNLIELLVTYLKLNGITEKKIELLKIESDRDCLALFENSETKTILVGVGGVDNPSSLQFYSDPKKQILDFIGIDFVTKYFASNQASHLLVKMKNSPEPLKELEMYFSEKNKTVDQQLFWYSVCMTVICLIVILFS